MLSGKSVKSVRSVKSGKSGKSVKIGKSVKPQNVNSGDDLLPEPHPQFAAALPWQTNNLLECLKTRNQLRVAFESGKGVLLLWLLLLLLFWQTRF